VATVARGHVEAPERHVALAAIRVDARLFEVIADRYGVARGFKDCGSLHLCLSFRAPTVERMKGE
jgi:hypothetical protein